MFHRVLRPAKLWRRTFQIDSWTGFKKSVSKTMLTSFSCKSCNKVLAETHESLRSTSRCGGSSFWLQISRVDPSFWAQTSHLLLFLLAPSATAPRGVPVPWMWRPAVALQFREARPVTAISLRETRSFEAKPSFLAFCHQMSSFHQALDAFFFLQ